MDYLPLFLKLQDQPCLIIGGGDIATRKARLLLQAGSRLTIVSPTLTLELTQWRDEGRLQHLATHYATEQLAGQRLVIAATDDTVINTQIFADCEARSILVNTVDDPAQCRFILPAIVDRSPIMVAVSSGGNAPVLARIIKSKLESWLPHGYGALAQLAGKLRNAVKAQFPGERERRRFWETALNGPAAEQAMAGDIAGAQATLQAALTETAATDGAVYLVGAGPGNPDLLTFRALHLMQQSDVVLYDNLVSPQILELVRRDATRIYVGKKADKHALPQADINQLLVKLAREGKRVLRLKGGDPFIFGRGGEEIEELAAARISFEVVPGITAAAGASCYAGIPLTHRDYAQSVTFVTGHRRADEAELDWPRLTNPSETVVIYMGVQQAPLICAQLIAHGRDPATPVAIVERATWSDQRTLVGTLTTLPMLIEQHTVKPPALIIVGDVVKLHDKLAWREQS